MASNPLMIRHKSGREIKILCGAVTDEPRQSQELSPLRGRSPASHSSPIQLPSLSNQRSCAPEMRRRGNDWDMSRNNTMADHAHDPFIAPDMHGPLSLSSLGASAREYNHNSMMLFRHSRQTFPLTPKLRCSARGSINTVDTISPSTPLDILPENGYMPSHYVSFSSMGPGPMYPDPTKFQPRTRHSDGYAILPQALLPRFPGTRPMPHGFPMHGHHYHGQHYAASQGHAVPQIPAFPPPPATTITASGTKRYHCRYNNNVGCEKTFTTSGHASRHSKIHIPGKGFECTFGGCPKKFTRVDNMKQHLKDSHRPRSTSSLRKNASLLAVALGREGREGRGLARNMVRLQARQIQEV
ncbi:transcriptional repressor [Pseudogymnoascus australis]